MAIIRQKATGSFTWWVGVALVILAAAAFVVSRAYGRAGVLPGFASLAIILTAGSHTIYGLIFGVFANDSDWYSEDERSAYRRRRVIYALMALAVGLSIWLVGFHITLPVFLFLFIGLSLREWGTAAAMAFMIWLFTYVVLSQTMHIIFPATVLKRWLISKGYF